MDRETFEGWYSVLAHIRRLRKATARAMSRSVVEGNRSGKWVDREQRALFRQNSKALGQLDEAERYWRSLYRRSRSK